MVPDVLATTLRKAQEPFLILRMRVGDKKCRRSEVRHRSGFVACHGRAKCLLCQSLKVQVLRRPKIRRKIAGSDCRKVSTKSLFHSIMRTPAPHTVRFCQKYFSIHSIAGS